MQAKRVVQEGIRAAHVLVPAALPDKLGIYFHYLPPAHHGAFEALVHALRNRGYVFGGPDILFDETVERSVFLSIDDNYRATLDALSLFDRLKVPMTVYVNTAYLADTASPSQIETYFQRLAFDGPRYVLASEDLKRLRDAGHEIGAHTHTHRMLSRLSDAEAKDEILISKRLLDRLLDDPVRHFSYPFGMRRHFRPALRAYCAEVGFETVANAIPALQHAGHTPLAIQRSVWNLSDPLARNLTNLRIDGRLFERLTGRSAVG
ncbi:MAG: polysaccharide deacetylase family protein [Bacteroidota bacterium]